jgi:hypothetical protein
MVFLPFATNSRSDQHINRLFINWIQIWTFILATISFHSVNLLDNLFLILSTRPIFIFKTITFNIWLPCMWWSSWSSIPNVIWSEIWRSMCPWITPSRWWIRMNTSAIWSIWNQHWWLKRRICCHWMKTLSFPIPIPRIISRRQFWWFNTIWLIITLGLFSFLIFSQKFIKSELRLFTIGLDTVFTSIYFRMSRFVSTSPRVDMLLIPSRLLCLGFQ